jgi:hypothetical protein
MFVVSQSWNVLALMCRLGFWWLIYSRGGIAGICPSTTLWKNISRWCCLLYKSQEEGSMTKMLGDLDLLLLQTRRQHQRLIFFHKVVEGQIPAIPHREYISHQKPVRCRLFFYILSDSVVNSFLGSPSWNCFLLVTLFMCKHPAERSTKPGKMGYKLGNEI